MAKQDLKLTINDVAGLILSMNSIHYCTKDSEDGESFQIMSYTLNNGICHFGSEFKMTIFKNRVDIFYYPTLNISIELKDEAEFHELVGLYLDFKKKNEIYFIECLRGMIKIKDRHKNPFNIFLSLEEIERTMRNAQEQAADQNMIDDMPEFELRDAHAARRNNNVIQEDPVVGF